MQELKQDRLTSSRAVPLPPGRPAFPAPRLSCSSRLSPPGTRCSRSGFGCDSITPQSTSDPSCVCGHNGGFGTEGTGDTELGTAHNAQSDLSLLCPFLAVVCGCLLLPPPACVISPPPERLLLPVF